MSNVDSSVTVSGGAKTPLTQPAPYALDPSLLETNACNTVIPLRRVESNTAFAGEQRALGPAGINRPPGTLAGNTSAGPFSLCGGFHRIIVQPDEKVSGWIKLSGHVFMKDGQNGGYGLCLRCGYDSAKVVTCSAVNHVPPHPNPPMLSSQERGALTWNDVTDFLRTSHLWVKDKVSGDIVRPACHFCQTCYFDLLPICD